MTGGTLARRPKRSTIALLEIVAMMSLLLSYMWGWQAVLPGDFTLCVALYFGIGLASHFRRGETAAELGFRTDNWRLASRGVLRIVAPLLLIPLGLGAAWDSFHFRSLPQSLASLLLGVVWGTVQQYGLLCFFYRRVGDLSPDGRGQVVTSAILFGLLHLPNPFLCWVTFGAGMLSCLLYRRVPNVPVLGIAHGVVSFLISHALPDRITYGMRVGPGFFEVLP